MFSYIWTVNNRSEYEQLIISQIYKWFTQKWTLLVLWMSPFPTNCLVFVETAVTIFELVFHSITVHYCILMNFRFIAHKNKNCGCWLLCMLFRWYLIPNNLKSFVIIKSLATQGTSRQTPIKFLLRALLELSTH